MISYQKNHINLYPNFHKKLYTNYQNLYCHLGDVIDFRHLTWIELTDKIKQQSFVQLSQIILFLFNHICGNLEKLLQYRTSRQLSITPLLLEIFSTYNFKNFPISLKSKSLNENDIKNTLENIQKNFTDIKKFPNSMGVHFYTSNTTDSKKKQELLFDDYQGNLKEFLDSFIYLSV